ncbi:YncE family protein [Candidatus Odyssella acanthamoebae]|uniref:YncE family protein n=1 Tax=Candidatus Odyssella acanthamoebae TaxID=91604 RepID=UPI00068C22A1|nr:YncE family protein [Candidatus Paracaedibacter acanthamoebae]
MKIQEETKLTYAVLTTPDILQINGDTTLTLTVSNNQSGYINITSLAFQIPLGDNAKDLSTDLTGITFTKPTNWELSQDKGQFTATPTSPSQGKIGREGLTFTFVGIKVNAQVGTTLLTIKETTQEGGTLSTTLPLSKFPEQFQVSDLDATPESVNPGESTTLSWSGSAGSYELQYNQKTIPNLPSTGSYEIPADDLVDTTTFYLNVTIKGSDPTSPATLQREKTVTVYTPKIISFGGSNGRSSALPGGSIPLSWITENATQGSITDPNGNNWDISTDQLNNGQMTVGVPEDVSEIKYTLTIRGNRTTQTMDSPPIQVYEFKKLSDIHGFDDPSTLAINPGGTRLYVGNWGSAGTVSVIDIENDTNNKIADIITGFNYPGTLAIKPDGSRLYVADWYQHTVSVINIENDTNNKIADITGFHYAIINLAIKPDGSRLYATDSYNRTVPVIDIENDTNNKIADITGLNFPGVDDFMTLAIKPDGSRLYVANGSMGNGMVSVIDIKNDTNNKIADITGFNNSSMLAIKLDGSRLYVANSDTISVIDIENDTNNKIADITGFNNPIALAIKPDGSRLYVGNGSIGNRIVSVIDIKNDTNNKIADITGLDMDSPSALAIKPDGSRLYVANWGNSTVSVIDVPSSI